MLALATSTDYPEEDVDISGRQVTIMVLGGTAVVTGT